MKIIKKITVLFIITLLNTPSVFCQNIEELDKIKGFKNFTLGDDFIKWENDLSYLGGSERGVRNYLYKGNCCTEICYYPIDCIKLSFYENKLVQIFIKTEKFQKEGVIWRTDDFKSIKETLSFIFGEPTDIDMKKGPAKVTYYWVGQKVILFSDYIYKSGEGDWQQIEIFDKNYMELSMKSRF